MARKGAAQLDLVPPEEDGVIEPPRRNRIRPEPDVPKRRLRRAALWIAGAGAVAGAAFCAYQIDHFLASDSRFALRAKLSIQGAVYTPVSRIEAVFARDFGRSIYLAPLAERRRNLLQIDWVKDASVSRRWPDRIAVRIVERTPVAFLIAPGGGVPSLIDAEGVILTLPSKARMRLPALTGITREQPEAARKQRIGAVLSLLSEAAPYTGQISEIDAADARNLKVTFLSQNRAFRLWIGDRNFSARFENFVKFQGEINRRLPYADTFDLRLDDRITVPAEANPAPPAAPAAAKAGAPAKTPSIKAQPAKTRPTGRTRGR